MPHLDRSQPFLLLHQVLSYGQNIQLCFWGKQLCQKSGVNDLCHLGQKEKAVSDL